MEACREESFRNQVRGSRSLGHCGCCRRLAQGTSACVSTGSPTWQVVEPLRVLGVGAVANKLAPAVARETGTSWEKGEEVGPEDKLSGPQQYSWTILGCEKLGSKSQTSERLRWNVGPNFARKHGIWSLSPGQRATGAF